MIEYIRHSPRVHNRDDVIYLGLGKFRKAVEGQDTTREMLRHRQMRLGAQPCHRRLQVIRDRVVNIAVNPRPGEMLLEVCTVTASDDVEMGNVFFAANGWTSDFRMGYGCGVA